MKIRDASGWTIFIFGVLAFLLGACRLDPPRNPFIHPRL
jgi:hypothetical protein